MLWHFAFWYLPPALFYHSVHSGKSHVAGITTMKLRLPNLERGGIIEMGTLVYDTTYLHGKEAYKIDLRNEDGTLETGRFVVDYHYGKKYRISADNATCTIQTFSASDSPMPKHCIPDNATHIGTAYMGYGSDSIEFDSWYWEIAGTDWGIHMDVETGNCIPIMETRKGSVNGNVTEMALEYRNYKVGIEDASVFDLPHSCSRS